ncbi:hypothetical protein H2204_011658 [Knufia peltigerae]|uniref:Nucleoside phosphorylase domain-containing protein n=1 Tax=Knufia peltigerae TaxID=1002370 RepID=A0AA38XTS5_9EURO|nr:hypothetical protein H2204_011658 [Knufia peltigerae]
MPTRDEFTVGYICADGNALTSCVISLDEEHPPLPQYRHDNNAYQLGKIGSHKVAMCCLLGQSRYQTESAAVDMMRSFPRIELLILVNGDAGAVPRDAGQVHVGDVVVAQRFAKTDPYNPDGGLVEMNLLRASGLLATADMNTDQQWSLDEGIATLIAKNDRWGGKCRRPAGDDVDKLDKFFDPRRPDEPACVVHRHGLVISDPTYPEDREHRESIAAPGTFASTSAVCFDHGQTAGLPLYKPVLHEFSVLGVSNYCDEDAQRDRNTWTRYASMGAAACARKIVMSLATENSTGWDGEGCHDYAFGLI